MWRTSKEQLERSKRRRERGARDEEVEVKKGAISRVRQSKEQDEGKAVWSIDPAREGGHVMLPTASEQRQTQTQRKAAWKLPCTETCSVFGGRERTVDAPASPVSSHITGPWEETDAGARSPLESEGEAEGEEGRKPSRLQMSSLTSSVCQQLSLPT